LSKIASPAFLAIMSNISMSVTLLICLVAIIDRILHKADACGGATTVFFLTPGSTPIY
jgi:hypothetical protein